MSNTIKLNACPNCGAAIPETSPHGLCPKCVLSGAATGLEPEMEPADTAEIPSLGRVANAFPQLDIIELIGRGAMGFVFKARQPRLDRFIALKLLPDKLARDARFTERFNREGRVLARLNHPNIVSIYDFGKTEHFYYLLMEYVDGVNLRQAMQSGRFSPGEALAIVPKICEALQYAHEQGVLHRDIKPANILLDTKGHVKIADFGIAKLAGDDKPEVTLTATGMALGTPQYMAPEQLEEPSQVDHRADIYSLGVVFYEMLTGELPIGRFAAPSSKTPVGANVDEVVFRTLEKDRERRFQTAGEMKTQVEHLGEMQNTAQFPAPASSRSGDRTLVNGQRERSNGWKVACILLAVLGIGTLAFVGLVRQRQALAVFRAASARAAAQRAADAAAPWIGLTVTAVELRESDGVRSLAIDYLDDVHGTVDKAFPWESTIPGFKAQTTTSEFLKENPGGTTIRHQRAAYRLPDDIPRERLEQFRASLEKALLLKSIRVELGGKILLFDFSTGEGASLKAWVAAVPPIAANP